MEKEKRINLHITKTERFSSCSSFLLPSIKLSTKLTSFSTLEKLGFYNVVLYDMTPEHRQYFPNSLLLIFNPSYSFFNNDWDSFMITMVGYPNLIKTIEFGGLVFGFWFSIAPEFGNNLRYFYKKGQYSEFPQNYLKWLGEKERKICTMDDGYRKKLELALGYEDEEGYLEGLQLASIPEKEDYCFNYNDYI